MALAKRGMAGLEKIGLLDTGTEPPNNAATQVGTSQYRHLSQMQFYELEMMDFVLITPLSYEAQYTNVQQNDTQLRWYDLRCTLRKDRRGKMQDISYLAWNVKWIFVRFVVANIIDKDNLKIVCVESEKDSQLENEQVQSYIVSILN